jgi:hypothetical protein
LALAFAFAAAIIVIDPEQDASVEASLKPLGVTLSKKWLRRIVAHIIGLECKYKYMCDVGVYDWLSHV